MNQESLANCFCIISHPAKPKFLVVRHEDGWFPPTVQVPAEGFIGLSAQMISDSVLSKYGLRTVVLRHTFEASNLHCVELDVIAPASRRQQEAVWVGDEEYQRFRSNRPDGADPLAAWLEQATRKHVPRVRPPWERTGWYQKASAWFEGELERHQVQVAGSIQQHQMCWHDSALLRIRTSQGTYFLKASHPEAPREGVIARALSRRWPAQVVTPLAISKKQNWMIFGDPGPSLYHAPDELEVAGAAREMARLQLESAADAGDWLNMGAQEHPPGELAKFLQGLDRLQETLQSGLTALDDDEWEGLLAVAPSLIGDCERLADSRVPNAFVHPGFLPSRVFRKDGGFCFNGWSELILGHPFFSGACFVRGVEQRSRSLPAGAENAMEPSWADAAAQAYLEPFGHVVEGEDLAETLALCSGLLEVWDLYRWRADLNMIETGSVSYNVRLRSVQQACRDLLEARVARA